MRSQCAVYVDAGYLLAATATRVTGTSLRSAVDINHEALIEQIIAQAEADSGLPLLRVNWYDSGSRPNGLPDYVQERIGIMPRVKLRLGRRSFSGEQKGVDLRIGLDLATHGRSRVADVMYLVSGDDDLTEAVEEAQAHGVQVTLLVVPDHAGRPLGVAKHLHRAADGLLLIDEGQIDRAVSNRQLPPELLPRPEVPASGRDAETVAAAEDLGDDAAALGTLAPVSTAGPADAEAAGGIAAAAAEEVAGASEEAGRPQVTPKVFAARKSTTVVAPTPRPSVAWSSAGGGSLQEWQDSGISPEEVDLVAHGVVEGWCRTATPATLASLREGRPSIPGELDRALLMDLSHRSEVYDIPESARHALRDRFWAMLDRVRLT